MQRRQSRRQKIAAEFGFTEVEYAQRIARIHE